MEIFALQVDFDDRGDCDWGMLRHECDLEDIWPLYGARPLAPSWRPMVVTLHDAHHYAEFVYFTAGGWAVRPEARRALEPVIRGNAEFLPLVCDTGDEFFALHPLQLADLGPQADAHRNGVSGNITTVRRYSFEPAELAGKTCFRIRHPPGSASGPESGSSDVLVSAEVKECLERCRFLGVRCERVYPQDERRFRF